MEDEDLMSIFGSGMELNFEAPIVTGDEDTEENEDIDLGGQDDPTDKEKNKPIEGEDPENVDGEEDDNNEGDDSDDDSSPNLYSSISNVLFEQGIIPSLESSDNIKTAEDFVDVFKKEIDVQAQQRLETYLENLDLEKIAVSRKNQLELESIDEDYLKDNIEVAKDIIFRDYINQGLSEDRAKKLLRKTIDLGEDMVIEDALESTQSLKEFEKRAEAQEKIRYQENLANQAKEQEQINNAIKSTIYNSKEVIAGINNTKALQDRVFKSMTEVVAKDPNTGEMQNKFMQSRASNPIEFDTKMYYLYELTNGFTDLSAISKTVTSKAVKNLESVLRKTKFEDNGTPAYLQDPDSYSSGFGSELNL
jgi:hypothetical protein